MPRIPDALLDRIKREVPMTQLVERQGVALRRVGESLVGRCNRHEDTTPSLVITEEKNLFHCMGACQKGGSTIDWVMWQQGVGFYEAARGLAEEFFAVEAREVFGDGIPNGRHSRPPLPSPLDADADGDELARQVIAYYHAAGRRSAEMKGYLVKRGLDDDELVSTFELGFADRTLGVTLTVAQRRRLQKLGYFRESGHEHFNGSLVVPILGLSGEVLGCYGRKVTGNLRNGTPDHLYLPGPHRGVFNPAAFESSPVIVLCEALLDALTFWRHGLRNVTSAYGVEGVTDELFEAFVTHRTERVLIAFDRDEAGDRGAEKVAKRLGAAGVSCHRVLFPRGMDANDAARTMQPAKKTLDLFLRSAEWLCGGNGAKTVDLITSSSRPAPARDTSHDMRPHGTPLNGSKAAPLAALESPEAAKKGETRAAEEEKPVEREAQNVNVAPLNLASPVAAPRTAEASEASPVPAAPSAAKAIEVSTEVTPASAPDPAEGLLTATDDVAEFLFADRRYRARGLAACRSLSSLRLSFRVERPEKLFAPPSPLSGWFQDTLDLLVHRQRQHFEREAAKELGVRDDVIRWDLGRILCTLEDLQEKRLVEKLTPTVGPPEIPEERRQAALELAKDPDLVGKILEHFDRSGVVGEVFNKLVLYFGAASRKLERPLAIVIRSSSAAGKTALMDAALSFIPKEEKEKYSALTENSLFYFEGKDFKHKVLALVEEEGAQRATYALKLLQSEGEITIASTGKDAQTGKLVTKEYRVEGPVMILLTSTAVEIDEELLNRCLVLSVDEGREQTRAIHKLQREAHTLEGLRARYETERLRVLHQDFQRLLRPLFVHNPYARELTFLDEKTRTRRDHTKYLTLIDAVALVHQHQREIKRDVVDGRELEYLEAELSDVALANGIAKEVLGRSLDELPPQTRRLLGLLDEMVRETSERTGVGRSDYRFTRRDVRSSTGWGDTQLKIHLARLVELEYVLVHRGDRGQSFAFELLYAGEGQDGKPFLLGLTDVEKLASPADRTDALAATVASESLLDPPSRDGYDGRRSGFSDGRSGSEAQRSALGRAPVGPWSGDGRSSEEEPRPAPEAASRESEPRTAETALIPPVPLDGCRIERQRRLSAPNVTRQAPRLNLLRFPPHRPVASTSHLAAAAVALG